MQDRAEKMYHFQQFCRTAMTFLAIATEIDSYCNRRSIMYGPCSALTRSKQKSCTKFAIKTGKGESTSVWLPFPGQHITKQWPISLPPHFSAWHAALPVADKNSYRCHFGKNFGTYISLKLGDLSKASKARLIGDCECSSGFIQQHSYPAESVCDQSDPATVFIQ
jgi:hypothetical protein